MMERWTVIDGDGHILERDQDLLPYLEAPFNQRTRGLFPRDNWDRNMGGRLGKEVFDLESRLKDMDLMGVDISVLYPTSGLLIGAIREPDFAVALARAYNSFLADFCNQSPRLKGVAVIPVQRVHEAVKELNRAVTELGLVGVLLPGHGHGKNLGSPEFDPIYAEAERLGVPLGVHPASSFNPVGVEFDTFLCAHAIAFTSDALIQSCGIIMGGVPEKFPRLKIAFLESGCGWIPYWMERLDSHYEKRAEEAPLLKAKPSEYMRHGNIYYSCEPEEQTLSYVLEWVGEDKMLYASDYPHWDMEFPDSVEEIKKKATLTDEAKRKILGENARRLYGLP
ncbi:MAG: amidohydrolase [Deltaproteobacteria bacterium]|nr:amidohydrolase [Deltaproteobacteria bacterium]MBI3076310.1 amidohydrolase [Deltaproteobacteria bacterium]